MIKFQVEKKKTMEIETMIVQWRLQLLNKNHRSSGVYVEALVDLGRTQVNM